MKHLFGAAGRTSRAASKLKIKSASLAEERLGKTFNEIRKLWTSRNKLHAELKPLLKLKKKTQGQKRKIQKIKSELQGVRNNIKIYVKEARRDRRKVGKNSPIGNKFEKFITHPYVIFGAAAAPGAAMVGREVIKERRRGQENKIRKLREERKRKELFTRTKELEQRKEREFRKRIEAELKRESLLRKTHPDFYPTLLSKPVRKSGRPKKKGRKKVYYPVKRNGKVYYIRRGIRSKRSPEQLKAMFAQKKKRR